jgi:DNA polymerase III epsilon subunit-like protein
MDLVAVDVETTGLDPEQDRIVEFCFAAVKQPDLGLSTVWTDRVDPQQVIPSAASQVHGITRSDVKQKPGFETYAAGIQEVVEDAAVIAYNAVFDIRFLHAALQRHGHDGFTETVPVIDPYRVFQEQYGEAYSLEDAYHVFTGERPAAAHTADGDVAAAVTVLQHQLQDCGLSLQDVATPVTV